MDIKTDVEQNFASFIREAKDIGRGVKLAPYDEIIFAGMGGSGIAGDLLKIFVKDVPFFVVHDYSLPFHAGVKSLVFISTYSGGTEEMISVYNDALKRRCQVIVLTSGESMKERCRRDKVQYLRIPSGIQPRAALPYLVIPVLNILGFAEWDLNGLVEAVSGKAVKDKAKELAEKLVDKTPLVYSSHLLYPVAYRWKTQFNENAKVHAFANEFPELNHNELEAYENLKGDYYVIIIRDESDSIKVKERMDLTKSLIMKKGVSVTEIAVSGKNRFNKVMTEIYLGDLVSIRLAELYGVDPTPVSLIEQFKKQLR